jgi:hypothetical protein
MSDGQRNIDWSLQHQCIFGRAQSEAVPEVEIRVYIRMLFLHPLLRILGPKETA